jgi:MATE family multidrug resistance protein
MVSLAVPVAATQLSTMLLGLVDTLMVGRVSVEALGAAAIANVWIIGVVMFANGILFGLDPIVSQAHGAGDAGRVAVGTQRGLILALILSVPTCWLVSNCESALILLGQDPTLARSAQGYALARIPGLPFFLLYSVVRGYLQNRGLVRPALWVVLVANVFNVFFNWVLIFGNLGLPALGLVGAGLATTLTRIVSFVGLVGFVSWFGLHRGAWVPWGRASVEPAGMREIFVVGLPIALQISLEMWAFSGATLIAGLLGPVALAAHTISLSMASIAFMLPLGVAQASTARVGNLIGARRRDDAQRASWVSLALGAGVMLGSATLFVGLRHELPRLYTPDVEVIALAATILPIAAAFQIFDGTQAVGCGILRGMGRVRPALFFNGIGYWLIGLPLGAWLALRTRLGIAGLWWGLCLGLAIVAGSLVAWVHYRGPRRMLEGSTRF